MVDYTKRPGGSAEDGSNGVPDAPGKVTLTKSTPTVSLSKRGSTGGTLRVNLNWTSRPDAGRGGFFKRGTSSAIDLDLGCLYELTDGTKGAVQALGNAFRDQNPFVAEPIVWLDGDDRSGTNSAGENLFVDLRHLHLLKRIMIFAFIYEGVPNWAAADGVVTLFPNDGPQIEVRLDEHDAHATMCGIAMLENRGGELSVRREVRYVGTPTARRGLRLRHAVERGEKVIL